MDCKNFVVASVPFISANVKFILTGGDLSRFYAHCYNSEQKNTPTRKLSRSCILNRDFRSMHKTQMIRRHPLEVAPVRAFPLRKIYARVLHFP